MRDSFDYSILLLAALAVLPVDMACSSSTEAPSGATGSSIDVVAKAPPPVIPIDATPTTAFDSVPALLVPTSAVAHGGDDFIDDAQLLFRVAACGSVSSSTGPAAPIESPDAAAIRATHCAEVASHMKSYREQYVVGGATFFAGLVPASAPTTVVYPFGGGDLLSALVAFPNATDITTVSLELAGDPRRLRTMSIPDAERSLKALRAQIGGLLEVGSNTSVNLSAQQRNDLPGQVSSFLMGLATVGAEPVSMRYFRILPGGALQYLTKEDIAATEQKQPAARRKATWNSPNFSEAFANVEISFRKAGETTVRVHRHIGWNLGNSYLKTHGELLAYLRSKGKVTMLTKGASYLLWSGEFSAIRNYMLENLAWMLSDSTGIPPKFATAAKMKQTTYGHYAGAFLPGAEAVGLKHSDDFRALWTSQKRRKLPFRFGYVDAEKQAHLLVTEPM
jgi:hypothetical protein